MVVATYTLTCTLACIFTCTLTCTLTWTSNCNLPLILSLGRPPAPRESSRLTLLALSRVRLVLSGRYFIRHAQQAAMVMRIFTSNGTVLSERTLGNGSVVVLDLKLDERAVFIEGSPWRMTSTSVTGMSVSSTSTTSTGMGKPTTSTSVVTRMSMAPPRFAALAWEDSNGCGSACSQLIIEAHRLESFDANASAQALNVWVRCRRCRRGGGFCATMASTKVSE